MSQVKSCLTERLPGIIPFCGVGRPVATPTPLSWAGHPLAFIVKVESAGSHVMHKILCVCVNGGSPRIEG